MKRGGSGELRGSHQVPLDPRSGPGRMSRLKENGRGRSSLRPGDRRPTAGSEGLRAPWPRRPGARVSLGPPGLPSPWHRGGALAQPPGRLVPPTAAASPPGRGRASARSPRKPPWPGSPARPREWSHPPPPACRLGRCLVDRRCWSPPQLLAPSPAVPWSHRSGPMRPFTQSLRSSHVGCLTPRRRGPPGSSIAREPDGPQP